IHCRNSGKNHQNVVPATIANCSARGPSASAGKKVRPPTIMITPTTRPTNNPPVVGKVPSEAGTDFLLASEPAIAIVGMIIMKRPTNIATAPVMLKNSVLAVMPANAEPLLAVLEVERESISEKPSGPVLPSWVSARGLTAATRCKTGDIRGG